MMDVIVVMKGNHIIKGKVDLLKLDTNLIKDDKIIRSFSDINDFHSYKDFMVYSDLLGIKFTKKSKEEYLKSLNVKSLYFYDPKPIDNDAKAFNGYWFKYTNYQCTGCKKKCKQSSRIIVSNCKEFVEK